MCGILIGKSLSEKRVLSILHRGTECKIINGVFDLCHHRLPIQTLDYDEWGQPVNIGGNKWLLFNGEIFNYPKNFSSDTEYLQSLFKRISHINIHSVQSMLLPHITTWDGFWAITLVDLDTGDILAFTDPLGKKSLYVNSEGEVCSEIKALITPESLPDMAFLSGVRKWGYVHDSSTPWQDIKRLTPNYFWSWNINSPFQMVSSGPYFQFTPCDIPSDYEELKDLVWEKLESSVTNRLISNYPISFLLSGGLDSAILGGLLVKVGADVSWYTINNGEDAPYVEACETHWGIQVKRLEYNMEEDHTEIFHKWNESPIDMGSVIPQYHLFQAIKTQGSTRVVISGDGADELFGGYRRSLEYDSQHSDIFHELSYYHLPRLDKLSMAHTLELRTPYLNLDLVRIALALPRELRTEKKILKDTFRGLIPDAVIERRKHPLKNPSLIADQMGYRQQVVDKFLDAQLKGLF
jgi:asparagine synthase (glutamine-hydrolysing)